MFLFSQWFTLSGRKTTKIEKQLQKELNQYQLLQHNLKSLKEEVRQREARFKLLAKKLKKAHEYEQFHLLKTLNQEQFENIRQYRLLKNRISELEADIKYLHICIEKHQNQIKESKERTV